MSHTLDRGNVICDGQNCRHTARLPIALRALLDDNDSHRQAVEGWLFVTRESGVTHYCPCCAERYLPELAGSLPEALEPVRK